MTETTPPMMQCPHCKEQIQKGATVCKHCGKKIESAVRKRWTAVAGIGLGLTAVSLFCNFAAASVLAENPTVGTMVSFALGIGFLMLITGAALRGFTK